MTLLDPIRRQALLAKSAGLDEPGASEWIQVKRADARRAAEDEATRAYRYWFETSDRIGFAIYRAAQDRADQAQDVLAAHATA
ncbi:MAG: hypothetical protein ACJ76Z_10305 [Thermoleophilaceae bacterium]